jgi:hypothetical protein
MPGTVRCPHRGAPLRYSGPAMPALEREDKPLNQEGPLRPGS